MVLPWLRTIVDKFRKKEQQKPYRERKSVFRFPISQEQERNAIYNFLRSYWTVNLEDERLTDLIDLVLDEGIRRGIAYRELDLDDPSHEENQRLYTFRKSLEFLVKQKTLGQENAMKRFTPKDYEYIDFHDFMDLLISKVEKNFGTFSAKPHDYDFYGQMHQSEDSKISTQFHGTRLHPRFRDSWPGFKRLLSSSMVQGYESSNFPPERTLICAIALQGLNIGVYHVDYSVRILAPKDWYKPPEKED